MIVPFIFSLDEVSSPMWIANKFYDFCYKNKFPIIIQEKLSKNPSYYIEQKHSAMSEQSQKAHQYQILSDEKFNEINKIIITNEDEEKIVRKYGNVYNAAVSLLKEEDKDFEKIIEEKLSLLADKNNEEIEAVITWLHYPSLEKVLKKMGIPLLHYELSTLRPGNYRETFGYFKFGSKYENKEDLKQYQKFNNDINSFYLLNRHELLNLLITDVNAEYVSYLDTNPIYEVGYATGMKQDIYVEAYDGTSYMDTLKKIEQYVPAKKISLRAHPANPISADDYDYQLDTSKSSMEWILKCKNIVCSISNVGYETILFGRGLISTSDIMMSSFGQKSSLEFNDPKHYGIKELNFLTFCYYAPYELMFNSDYIRWRLKEKDIKKIYNFNMEYILNKYDLSLDKLSHMNIEDRFMSILNTHDISSDRKNNIAKFYLDCNIEQERKNNLESTVNHLESEISSMLNSKSWKLTKPMRDISSKVTSKRK